MAEITDDCTLKLMTPLAGVNLAIIQTPATADDGDTIELEDISGITAVKKVLYVTATQDPTGTSAAEPMIWSDTTDTITIGGSTDNKRRDILVIYQ